jgi:hypothetical protein
MNHRTGPGFRGIWDTPARVGSTSGTKSEGERLEPISHADVCQPSLTEGSMLRILLWIIGIIFLIGLLVVFGVFKAIF